MLVSVLCNERQMAEPVHYSRNNERLGRLMLLLL